jgi:hypothetical protein
MSRVQFKLSTQLVATLTANIPPEARSAFAELVLGQVLNAPPTLRHARVRLGLSAYYCCEQTQELVPRAVGRPRKYSVDDLARCLKLCTLTAGEFCERTNDQCGISRAMFYRLLEKGSKEGRFRQCATDERWELVSKTHTAL